MDTPIQAILINVPARNVNIANVEAKTTSISDFWKNAEFNRFGIISMLIVIITCLGGFAAAVAVKESTFQLAMVVSSAMAVEALILAVMPMRAIFIASAISLIISLAVIFF